MKRLIYIKILIIDDSTVIRKTIKEGLRNFNIDFIEATDGNSGVVLATTHKPDLILLDLNLPDIHGFEALKRIRENPECKNIPFIITTVSSVSKDVQLAKQMGVYHYMLKPIDISTLLSKILQILNITEEELTGRGFAQQTSVSEQNIEASKQTSSFQKVDVTNARENMVLGLPATTPEGNILFKAGTILDKEKIAQLIKNSIKFIFIKP